MARKRLGERLIEAGLVTREQLSEALQLQKHSGARLGEALMRLGYLPEGELIRVLSEDANIPFLPLDEASPSSAALTAVPEALARAHTALPLQVHDGRVTVALANPFDLDAVSALERATGRMVSVVAAPRNRIATLVDQLYRGGSASPRDPSLTAAIAVDHPSDSTAELRLVDSPDFVAPEGGAESGTAKQVVDDILLRGVNMGATDIHIEPSREGVRLRFRVDGLLREGRSYPTALQAPINARLKVLAGLNLAETRLPQDGRFRFNGAGREIDLRLSTYPTMFGEDVVLRILDRSRIELNLASLGMMAEDIRLFKRVLKRPHGLITVTGPTGSGKTTTLYAALHELNTGERCVLTLEDPIEYEVEGVRQGQIDTRAGLTFASGLRALLRHDPDVILVGEMRDEETVKIGVSAALTGHMVLTTLHTNTAAGAIPRLLDMGVEPFLLASSLQLVVAQRLVRTLCPKCKVLAEAPAAVRERFGLGDAAIYAPGGCRECRSTGYKGRIGLFELLPVNKEVANAIHERQGSETIQRLANRPTLLQHGLQRVREGLTSLDEVFRAAAG